MILRRTSSSDSMRMCTGGRLLTRTDKRNLCSAAQRHVPRFSDCLSHKNFHTRDDSLGPILSIIVSNLGVDPGWATLYASRRKNPGTSKLRGNAPSEVQRYPLHTHELAFPHRPLCLFFRDGDGQRPFARGYLALMSLVNSNNHVISVIFRARFFTLDNMRKNISKHLSK
jgi:hypothetical protein